LPRESAVISHFVVTYSEFMTELHVGDDYRLRIQPAEDNSILVVAPLDGEPEPLRLARVLINDFEFHVVATLVFAHQIGLYHRVPLLRADTNQVVPRGSGQLSIPDAVANRLVRLLT
jgi:hypothetical protein